MEWSKKLSWNRPRSSRFGEQFEKRFSGSKVVDKEGKPLRVYHGTKGDFSGQISTEYSIGACFSESPEVAEKYAYGIGANIRPVYLIIRNPAPLSVFDKVNGQINAPQPQRAALVKQALIDRGYDGILNDTLDCKIWVAFHPEQIISTFDSAVAT